MMIPNPDNAARRVGLTSTWKNIRNKTKAFGMIEKLIGCKGLCSDCLHYRVKRGMRGICWLKKKKTWADSWCRRFKEIENGDT